MTYRLSQSGLNLMKECPRCFWIRFRRKTHRPSGAFPSLPGGMDKLLKNYFDSFRKKGKVPPEILAINRNLKLFSDVEKIKEWRKVMTGINWTDGEGNVIFGGLDDLLEKNGRLIVVDYKTGGYPPKDTLAERYRSQLEMYNFLLRKNEEKTENHGYVFYYYPLEIQNSVMTKFKMIPFKIGLDGRNVEARIKKALSVLKNKIPEPSENCEYCKWGSEWSS